MAQLRPREAVFGTCCALVRSATRCPRSRCTTLKNRIHATPITFGHPCPALDLFGLAGRKPLDRRALPAPWRRTTDATVELIDDLELQIARLTCELKRRGASYR